VEEQRFGEPYAGSELPSGEGFGFRAARSGDTAWVSLGGELDVYATPSLRSALRNVEETSPRTLVLDLRGLEFLDSSGLAVLLGAHERAAAAGDREVKLVIAGSRAVESLFETLRAQDFLDIVDDPATLVSGARSSR
jgi:anti-sigma B factor antagonist